LQENLYLSAAAFSPLHALQFAGALSGIAATFGGELLLGRETNGEWVELLRLHSDEQVAGDPVLAGHWFVVCTRSKARTRVLLYQIAKANLPIVRLSVEIEGPANARVRLDSFTLAVADDFGRLQVFELTYGERIRDIRL
jgi:hypothetical protein